MAAQLPIPKFNSLAEIYPSSSVLSQGERWSSVAESFKERYGHAPSHIVRAPGRVNILGEHVDYSLFPVLPAAIEQDIIIAIRTTGDRKCRLANVLPSFAPSEFTLTHHQSRWDVGLVSPKDGGGWENYVKVAMLECLANFFPAGPTDQGPVGIDMLVSGTVPPGAGLSSSAAFVVSSVIMFLTANNLTEGMTKGDVVRLAIASEHRMGLRTGGMDQSASTFAEANSLLHISFHPNLEARPFPLPPSLAVVITNSMAPHALADSAPERYNLRVVEVLCASRLLLHAWGVDAPRTTKAGEEGRIWLREAIDMWEKNASEDELYKHALEDLPAVLNKQPGGWTREQMIAASGLSEEAFTETYLDFIPVRSDRFQLFKRAEHTFAESLRVSRFKAICDDCAASPPVNASDSRVAELGTLLNQSHESLRDLFEATVPEVEQLRDLCLANGALGARQTGGGWGGAVISLLPVDKVPEFVTAIRSQWKPFRSLSDDEIKDAAFATMPGVGAGIYVVDGDVN